jgi:hypothetical protein
LRAMYAGHGATSALHLGEDGDFTRLAMRDLPDADALVTGPPCPPFSPIGLRGGWEDPQGKVFKHIIKAIAELVRRGCLKWFIIENVVGILAPEHGVLGRIRQVVTKHWQIDTLRMNSKSQGQSRPRIYIVGWWEPGGTVPVSLAKLLPALPSRTLSSIILRLPSSVPVAAGKATNLKLWLQKLRPYCDDQKLRGTYACFPIDRCPTKSHACFRVDDCVPCLRASNNPLWVIDLGWGAPRVCRPLHIHERCMLQGIDPGALPRSLSLTDMGRGCGNAMTVAVVGAVMCAVLSRLQQNTGRKRARPRSPSTTSSSSSSSSRPDVPPSRRLDPARGGLTPLLHRRAGNRPGRASRRRWVHCPCQAIDRLPTIAEARPG